MNFLSFEFRFWTMTRMWLCKETFVSLKGSKGREGGDFRGNSLSSRSDFRHTANKHCRTKILCCATPENDFFSLTISLNVIFFVIYWAYEAFMNISCFIIVFCVVLFPPSHPTPKKFFVFPSPGELRFAYFCPKKIFLVSLSFSLSYFID